MTLIERIEALTGPDREADAEIYCAIKGLIVQKHGYAGQYGLAVFYEPNGVAFYDPDIPLYTASIDAALTLFPDTNYENEDSSHLIELKRHENVVVSQPNTQPVIMGAITFARCSDFTNPAVQTSQYPLGLRRGGNNIKNRQHAIAIALCIAALKARGVK